MTAPASPRLPPKPSESRCQSARAARNEARENKPIPYYLKTSIARVRLTRGTFGAQPLTAPLLISRVDLQRREPMFVSDILSQKGGRVFAIKPDATLSEAVTTLRCALASASVLVLDANGNIAGIISERDVVRALSKQWARRQCRSARRRGDDHRRGGLRSRRFDRPGDGDDDRRPLPPSARRPPRRALRAGVDRRRGQGTPRGRASRGRGAQGVHRRELEPGDSTFRRRRVDRPYWRFPSIKRALGHVPSSWYRACP